MGASYETETRDGHTLDVLTETERGVRLKISRLGAELVSVARHTNAGWRGFLWRDDELLRPAEGWANHATVMGFFTHRIKDERTTYAGQELLGGTHSFLRTKLFDAPEFDAAASSFTYHLRPEQIAPHEYPRPVRFALRYALEGEAVRVTFAFRNLGQEPAHVSFGLHPGWACTSVETVDVEMAAGHYVQHFAPGNFLSGETREFDFEGGPMPFTKDVLPRSVLLELKDVPDPRFVIRDPAGGRQVVMRLDEAPYLTLWSDGHPFICLEPCWGLPDHHVQRSFEKKLGIEEVPAGGTLERSFTFRVSLIA